MTLLLWLGSFFFSFHCCISSLHFLQWSLYKWILDRSSFFSPVTVTENSLSFSEYDTYCYNLTYEITLPYTQCLSYYSIFCEQTILVRGRKFSCLTSHNRSIIYWTSTEESETYILIFVGHKKPFCRKDKLILSTSITSMTRIYHYSTSEETFRQRK